MAISTNAVSSSSAVPVIPAREPALALNAQREQTLATPPSAITRISSEGRLRAEFERQQIVATTQDNLAARSEAVPLRSTGEAASAAIVAPPAPNPTAASSQARNVEARNVEARNVEALERDVQQSERTSVAPRPAVLVETRDNDAIELPAFVPQRVTPNETPAGLLATRVSSAPAARFLSASATVENIANTSTPTTDDRINQVKISQTASEFVAAVNDFQNKRKQALDNAATVNQAQVVAELRANPERSASRLVENVTQPVAAGAARFDISTFAVGVARFSVAQSLNQSNAPAALASQENTNDTRRIARAEVAGQLPVTSRSPDAPEAPEAASLTPSVSSQTPQNAAQNSAASSLGGTGLGQSGLAKHLNALANLLTP